ncbi:MAG: hypothetical protein IJY28_04075 [Clostridia bacterium]|nr:hypothetical protein [Clostridia bacterium]
MMLKELDAQRIPIELGGVQTYLRYNLNAYRYLEEYFAGGIHDLLRKDMDAWTTGETMHLLRAGLIDAYYEQNEALLNQCDFKTLHPTMAALGRMLRQEDLPELVGQIFAGMLLSLPEVPVGMPPNPPADVPARTMGG